jgi:hypothetical protein
MKFVNTNLFFTKKLKKKLLNSISSLQYNITKIYFTHICFQNFNYGDKNY